ncbi:hypothetical protein RP20_CCG009605 [Aedes albopictus]|nr:hypothetical protein RP20_CCG009605 [Aedes albopictus]
MFGEMKCTVCFGTALKLTPIEAELAAQHHLCNRCLSDLFTADLETDSEDSDSNFEIKDDPTVEYESDGQYSNDCDEPFDDSISIKFEPVEDHIDSDGNPNGDQEEPLDVQLRVKPLRKRKPRVTPLEKLKVKCSYCDELSVNRKTLAEHIRECHPDEKVHRCLICLSFFKGIQQYEEHIRDVHAGCTERCNICLEGYVRKDKWKHTNTCLGRLLFGCTACDERYVSQNGFQKHVKSHLSNDGKKATHQETRTQEQVFTCTLCEDDKVYEENSYWNHVHVIHDGHHLRCPDCGKTFSNRKHMIIHTGSRCKVGAKARENYAKAKTEYAPSKCELCSKTYRNQRLLQTHVAKVHKVKPVVCDLCGISFANATPLRYHKIKSHTEPAEKCPQCPKRFHLAWDLRQHLATHETAGKFVCEECGRMFKRKPALELHVKSHQNRRSIPGTTGKHACELCDRRFKHNFLLVAHRKVHDPDRVLEKKFACKVCDKKFASYAGLYCHMKGKYVHQKRSCPVCNVVIKGKDRYAEHLVGHSGQS